MNKSKILVSVVLGTVLSTSLFASNSINHKQMCNIDSMKKSHMSKHKSKMKKRGMFFSTLKKLNLSTEQRSEIRDIMKSSNKTKKSLNDAFTQNSFDKDMFIEIMSEKRENMIKSKALKIEKIYNVLDETQKKQFKTLLDLKTQKMLNRGKGFDKNCHDRG